MPVKTAKALPAYSQYINGVTFDELVEMGGDTRTMAGKIVVALLEMAGAYGGTCDVPRSLPRLGFNLEEGWVLHAYEILKAPREDGPWELRIHAVAHHPETKSMHPIVKSTAVPRNHQINEFELQAAYRAGLKLPMDQLALMYPDMLDYHLKSIEESLNTYLVEGCGARVVVGHRHFACDDFRWYGDKYISVSR